MSPTPTVLIPGLLCTPRLYAEQLPALWQFGPVVVANHQHDDDLAAIAGRILATAPPQFTLVGLSMGGYLAFEIMRQAGHRVTRLALLNTAAHPDTAEATQRRHDHIALARAAGSPRWSTFSTDAGCPLPGATTPRCSG